MLGVLGTFVLGILVLCFVIWVVQLAVARIGPPSPIGQLVLGFVALVGLVVLWQLAVPVFHALGVS